MTNRRKSTESCRWPRNSTPVDMHSGDRMGLRRTMLGLSQESPGDLLGMTFLTGPKIRTRRKPNWGRAVASVGQYFGGIDLIFL